MNEYLMRKIRRVAFFSRGAFLNKVPGRIRARKFANIQKELNDGVADESIISRVNYYNRLDDSFDCDENSHVCSELSRSVGSYYYFDLKEHWRIFPSDLKLNHVLGDTIHVPETPTIVKSRPIHDENKHSVLLKLDRLRHYDLFNRRDKTPFREKQSRAVWRGVLNNPIRLALINRWSEDKRFDIGYIDEPRLDCALPPSPRLSVQEQLRNRCVISIEGNDVATNLKWIFASQSLCIMPRPKYETWFMEGALIPGTHFVEVRPDFADLDEKVNYYENHPDEAETIINSANQHCRQFSNKANEDLISVLVLQKYFELSGQLPKQP